MDFLIIPLILFLAYAVIFGVFCAYLASEKGRSGGSWFFLGVVFGILALLVLIGLPSEKRSSNEPVRASAQSTATSSTRSGRGRKDSNVRLCPHCVQEVHELATACPHCQRDLPEVERCSYEPCRKIINPTDDRCEDNEGNPYCGDLHRRRRRPVQCDECGEIVEHSELVVHRRLHRGRQ